ncbi:hypothetical protein A0256_14265 [Mucilaginibacter sp. PAMC 26640]|nr:hypothetical protein A0256_14265 [Mucilaginibacter sp. PAMC 26640]
MAAIIALVPIVLILKSAKGMIKRQPELVLENEGFYTEETGFLNWDLIFNEKVTRAHEGKREVRFTFSFRW